MAGADTVRGISYQHACAINAALEVLGDPNADALVVEGVNDIIDIEVIFTTGASQVIQTRSRIEPYTWSQAELLPLVGKWADQAGPQDSFVFLSDGQLNRAAAEQLLPLLDRAKQGALSESDLERLHRVGIEGPALGGLSRVAIRTRYPETSDLLNAAELRILRMHDLQRTITTQEASAIVDRLFTTIATVGGSRHLSGRILSRPQIAEIVGINLEELDAGIPWTAALADTYRAQVVASSSQLPDIGELMLAPAPPDALLVAMAATTIARVSEAAAQPIAATALLSEPEGACLVGPAGAGKTETMLLLSRSVGAAGGIPILLPTAAYMPGRLRELINDVVEQGVEQRLHRAAADAILASGEAVVLVDGFSELQPQLRRELARELVQARGARSGCSIIAAGRDAAALRELPLPLFSLRGLTPEQQRYITRQSASCTEEEAAALVRRFNERFRDLLTNPLFFTMVLGLHLQDREPSTRAEVYEAWVNILLVRSDHDRDMQQRYLAVLASVCARLIESARTTAPRDWWLVSLRAALDDARERGVFAVGSVTAEEVLQVISDTGLLIRDPATGHLVLIHDSFRDYLCSTALSRRDEPLPTKLEVAWEDAIGFFIQLDGFSDDLSGYLVDQASLPAVRVAASDQREATADSVADAQRFLRKLTSESAGDARVVREALPAGLCIATGARFVYAALLPDRNTAEFVQLADFGQRRPDASLRFGIPKPCGPLAVAALVWQATIREILTRLPGEPGHMIPAEPNELARSIESAFEFRRSLMRWYLAYLPEFEAHLTDRAKQRGLQGWLVPSDSGPARLYWRTDVDHVKVHLAEKEPEDSGGLLSGPATHFLVETAKETLRSEIEGLLPGAALIPGRSSWR